MKFNMPLRRVQERQPLVQCITNFVTVNDCANMILAAGGSPSMAHHVDEVEDAVSGVQALVCNMGAIEKVDAMILAGRRANELKIPVILDPVAAGGTQLRRNAVKRLLQEVQFSVIRGNASEIRYLAGQDTTGSGVDVGTLDTVTEENLAHTVAFVRALATRTGSVITVSGAMDLISNSEQTVILRNGCGTMARITGSGCMLTALTGAFCAAVPETPFEAACSAAAVMGICGEYAEQRRLRLGTGNATFRNDLIDAVFNITEEQLMEDVRYEIFKG